MKNCDSRMPNCTLARKSASVGATLDSSTGLGDRRRCALAFFRTRRSQTVGESDTRQARPTPSLPSITSGGWEIKRAAAKKLMVRYCRRFIIRPISLSYTLPPFHRSAQEAPRKSDENSRKAFLSRQLNRFSVFTQSLRSVIRLPALVGGNQRLSAGMASHQIAKSNSASIVPSLA